MKQIATNVVNGLVLDYRDMERNAIHHLYHASVQPRRLNEVLDDLGFPRCPLWGAFKLPKTKKGARCQRPLSI
jgi:hypothetical protein